MLHASADNKNNKNNKNNNILHKMIADHIFVRSGVRLLRNTCRLSNIQFVVTSTVLLDMFIKLN